MFNINTSELGGSNIYCDTHNHWIPLDPANRHYQEVLDAIIAEGAACFDGDIPAELQAAADEKQFNQQLAAYRVATARLAQYVVAVEPTVTRLVYSDDMDAEPTEETIENPLITTDNAERAAAQAVVDATPQAVKDAA
jgi:hypothetical protein